MTDTVLYVGSVVQGVDPKGRVAIPADFRDVIERRSGMRSLLIDFHPTLPCLRAFDESWPNALDERLQRLVDEGADITEIQREREQTFNDVERAGFDPSGRFNLPDFHKEEAGITSWAVFAGSGPTFNIWSPEKLLACDDVPERTRNRVAHMMKSKKVRG